ncbi:hypothetical protein [Hyalangium versicolor]|uniref:hypothetical protein n=1 Tax=Hyalangium versicolor TaxID=2861190 RepID=UPI001CC9E6CC|nr:hypothetical protein [Hyalangium versicolor]
MLALEARGRRHEALQAAEELAASLRQYPEDWRDQWVASVCEEVIDRNPVPPEFGIPQMRYPLLRDLICPVLLRRYSRRDANAARWFAWLMNRYSGATRLWASLPPEAQSPLAMLRKADEWNPGDVRVMAPLVEHLAGWFHHAMHELPMGVLYGMNGASIEQCGEMLEELERMEEWIRRLGWEDRYARALEYWRHQVRCYSAYLSQAEIRSYEAYLQLHFPDWRL